MHYLDTGAALSKTFLKLEDDDRLAGLGLHEPCPPLLSTLHKALFLRFSQRMVLGGKHLASGNAFALQALYAAPQLHHCHPRAYVNMR